MKPNGRLLSLDILRGLTIAGMILVNNPGSWSHVYAPLKHAQWHGLTPTDLVFPFFMFIMGVSMFLSLKKYNWELTPACFGKIAKRSILLFLVGYGLNWFGYGLSTFTSLAEMPMGDRLVHSFLNFPDIRVLGVMQRLAIVYFVGSVIGCILKSPRHILYASGAILFLYWILLLLANGFSFSEDNIIAVIDLKLIGESRMYHDTNLEGMRIAFDPEGLLSALGSIGHVLLGYYAGILIARANKDNEKVTRSLFIFGTIILFAGLLLQYACPVNKKIWSSTFALVTCGFGTLTLALLIWIIDIKGKKKWASFFEAFGINPLFLFVAGSVFSTIFRITGLKALIHDSLLACFVDPYFASLCYALLYVFFIWTLGYYLYKKQVYIKL